MLSSLSNKSTGTAPSISEEEATASTTSPAHATPDAAQPEGSSSPRGVSANDAPNAPIPIAPAPPATDDRFLPTTPGATEPDAISIHPVTLAVATAPTGVPAATPKSPAKKRGRKKKGPRAYFAVHDGMAVRQAIFLSWDSCKQHVVGYSKARYCEFATLEHAETYLGLIGMINAQKYAEVFGLTHPPEVNTPGGAAPAATTASGTANDASPSPYSFVKTLNRLHKRGPGRPPKNQTGVIVAPKKPSKNWMKESYNTDPPSEQWWELYFYLFAYKRKHNTLALDREKIRELWEAEKLDESFTLPDFWSWIQFHVEGYFRLGPDEKKKSVKVKRLSDLGFDFQIKLTPAATKGDDDGVGEGSFLNPAAVTSSAEKRWDDMYQKCLEYKQTHGNFDIPTDSTDQGIIDLQKWIIHQRLAYQKTRKENDGTSKRYLTDDKIKELEEQDFPFEGVWGNESIKLRNRRPEKRWEVMLQRLKEYYGEHQNFGIQVPKSHDGEEESEENKTKRELRGWLLAQNSQYASMREGKKSFMSDEKVVRLGEIGFKLEYVTFVERIDQLNIYTREHGAQEIPKDHELSKWAKKIQGQLDRHEQGKQSSHLTKEQLEEVKALTYFQENTRAQTNTEAEDCQWDEMYEKLRVYREEYGDCLVNTTNWANPLTKWVMAQRRYYRVLKDKGKSSKLDARKLQLLHEVGFVFRQKKDYMSFDQRVEELLKYKEIHGHLRVPTNIPGPGAFVAHCRDQYRLYKKSKKHSINEEKFQKLRDIGFEFQVGKSPAMNFQRHTWEERFQQLVSYKHEFGHTVVPQHYSGYNNLGQWVKTQRDHYRHMRRGKKTPMTAERALRLNDLGFAWEVAGAKRKREGDVESDEEDALPQQGQVAKSLKSTGTTAPRRATYASSSEEDDVEAPPRRFFY